MSADTLRKRLLADVDALLAGLPETTWALGKGVADSRRVAAELAWEDLLALAARDGAAGDDPEYVYESYASFQAVLTYRVAHQLVCSAVRIGDESASRPLRTAARRMSEQAKVRTSVEIHPAATIGRRFVVDHGFGTVVGEQTRLGDDCYLLQGVVLGGLSIGYSSAFRGTRHPHIGNRVEIGGGVSVFGPVTIGDDCRLEPGVRVTFNVPAGSRVRLVVTTQVSLMAARAEVHSVTAIAGGLVVKGVGLRNLRPALLSADRTVMSYLPVAAADDWSIQCGPIPRKGRARFLGFFADQKLACFVAWASELGG